jgi:N-acetylglucosamine-6-phosphate deacetylase
MVGFGTPAEIALAMATSRPAACLRRGDELGSLHPGRMADMVHLGADGMLKAVWRAGQQIA